ncbi:MAG TPA: PAS domain-containing protein, partial [Symbiobacteriaceae bacterium]|nr:PAS domain-containing protein [Symbiobacteriaceae bacterium]
MLQAILQNVDEGIHVVDRRGVTVLYNPQAGFNDGLEPHEVKGKHLLEVFPSLNEHTSTLLKVLETGEPIVNQQQTFANYKGLRV